MKAARLHEGETALRLEDVDAPKVRAGTVLVDVRTVFLPPFTASLVEGLEGLLTPPRPFTPGMDAVGTIRTVGTDVSGLEVGQRVYCDCYYRSRVQGGDEDTPDDQTFDVVLSAIEAEDASPIAAALPRLKRSGRLVMVGVTEAPLPTPTDLMVVMDLTVRGSLWFERHQATELLGMIAAGTLDPSALSVDEYSLDDIGEALEATRRPHGAFRQVVVRCGP